MRDVYLSEILDKGIGLDSSEIRSLPAAQEEPSLPDVSADRRRLFNPIATEPWNVGIPLTCAGKMPAHPGSKDNTPYRIAARRL